MDIKAQYLYLVDFDPSVGHEIQKLRPALVFGNNRMMHNLFPVMPLSTRVFKGKSFEIKIKKNENNRLFEDSLILANQIYTYDKQRFVKCIGKVEGNVYLQAIAYAKKFLAL